MDPISASVLAATLVPLANGAAGEAGKQIWTALTSYLRAKFTHDPTLTEAHELERQPDDAHGERLATRLVELARREDEFAGWLHSWLQRATPLVNEKTAVVNIVDGQAHIGGLVQAHTITGSLSFGIASEPPPTPKHS